MTENSANMQGPVCPIPLSHHDKIVIGHGSGGKMSFDLINNIFLPPFDNPTLRAGNDAGVISVGLGTKLAISTDSHVVWPLFFPGGDIGHLAVCGTVNDIAMMGATPLFLTAGFILEEGLEVSILNKIALSMQEAGKTAGIQIVAGDTKVVEKGKADGLFINTSGVGIIDHGVQINGSNAKPGDIVILSGTIGDHGIAVLTARGELGLETEIESDIAPLNHLVAKMLEVSKKIHVLRDPTRGGVATSLNEIARQSQVNIIINESSIPVKSAVNAACELLGFDPLYVANEGKLIAIVDREDADEILDIMQGTKNGEDAVIIGEVYEKPQGRVLMKTAIGSTRIIDILAGEMLPRIC
jgi:hydrogenase expression/formation protein HypE